MDVLGTLHAFLEVGHCVSCESVVCRNTKSGKVFVDNVLMDLEKFVEVMYDEKNYTGSRRSRFILGAL